MSKQCREVNINGQKYIREDAITTGDLRIVIANRGWVFVGRYAEEDAIVKAIKQASDKKSKNKNIFDSIDWDKAGSYRVNKKSKKQEPVETTKPKRVLIF